MQETSEIIYRHKNIYDLNEHMRFEAYSYAAGKRWKGTAKRAGFFFLLAVILMVALIIKQQINATDLILPAIMVVIGIVTIAMNGPTGRKIAWNMSPEVHDMEQEFLFYQDYFEYITPRGRVPIAYGDVHSIGETADNIYIMLNPQQGMSLVKHKCPGGLIYFLRSKLEENRQTAE